MTGIILGLIASFLPFAYEGMVADKTVESLGSKTMGIYVIHRIFVWSLSVLGFDPGGVVDRISTWALIVVLSYATALVASHVPGVCCIVA